MFLCMRTTINLDDALMREAKQLAARTGRTLTAVITDALRESLGRARRGTAPQPVQLTTFRGRGLQAGVDLDDSASLLDLMERGDDAA